MGNCIQKDIHSILKFKFKIRHEKIATQKNTNAKKNRSKLRWDSNFAFTSVILVVPMDSALQKLAELWPNTRRVSGELGQICPAIWIPVKANDMKCSIVSQFVGWSVVVWLIYALCLLMLYILCLIEHHVNSSLPMCRHGHEKTSLKSNCCVEKKKSLLT